MIDRSKPYRLPDPEKQPDSFLVILYKTLKKIQFNDRVWDQHYFSRCMKRVQELLEVFDGDVRASAQCMRDLKDRFEADGTRWTIETVVQYSFEWKSEHEQRNDRDCLRELLGAYKKIGVEPAALKPPPERTSMDVVEPSCPHNGWAQIKGEEFVCKCGERLYTPTDAEFAKFRDGLNGGQRIESGGAA